MPKVVTSCADIGFIYKLSFIGGDRIKFPVIRVCLKNKRCTKGEKSSMIRAWKNMKIMM